ncbi:HNH endonuclease [Anaerotignum propionicum]|uniref:HNH endonuclease n=1 Tax=Anaerotignum propionicum TaxID=28446 RepID=UPI00210DB5F6|nr:HNH endonuclease [Anaerotignum propionicum]MCQ4936784.1 HNH endonuclease [Anaerotignum propionicum]
MKIYYVCQNKTRKQESHGQYLWSPQKTKSGGNNRGYTNMSLVKKGDIIFHGAQQSTYAISVAKTDCYIAEQPLEIKATSKEPIWENKGYRIDSDYTFLTTPVNMRALFGWFKDHHLGNASAFTVNGECKELYLNLLDTDHAKFILNKALEEKQDKAVEYFLKLILENIFDEKYAEYDDSEIDEINTIIDESADNPEVLTWKGKVGTQEFADAPGAGNPKPKRSVKTAAAALIIANHECEYDHDPSRIFYKKSGIKYTEPHHLIPISKYKNFEFAEGKYLNLDTEENIVSLCSYCHNLLHYGRLEDKLPILEKLFNERQKALMTVGIELKSVEDLIKFYK